ncbi:MAG: fasciclin domain-containing protein [Pedobacter sp.]|nr:MAG: fasciclin domain-containing protein [Pedobacter sp.]
MFKLSNGCSIFIIQELTTVQGGKLKVSVKDGKVMINGANVTIADVVSSNGITHVIDGVLMPK